ncbi:sigma-70 family RNA polymerase sigma factor [Candidatus Pristimantibacillus sp. PTI5]|uniref:sigma-70 family RNA polymerase sigma factor n=1 Tax=Candidatus Pristimantibacillus sp. PTI5 TaxID=3400422 RepID=UPI003B016E38
MKENLRGMTDEELVSLYKHGCEDAFNCLFERYTRMISFFSNKYYARGLQKGDLFQDGSVGLYMAAVKFDPERGAFDVFAKMHINNAMINALKKAKGTKQKCLNDSLSFFTKLDEPDAEEFMKDFVVDEPTPEEVLLEKEELKEKQKRLDQLFEMMSSVEQLVFAEIMSCKSYKEVAKQIGMSTKSIDNALSRIKKKASRRVG